jgi:hypothetical protein
VSKKIERAKSKSTSSSTALPSLEEDDIDATIRTNVNYLLDQLVLDIAQANLEAEYGNDWMSSALVGSSPQKWLDEVDKFRFHLEQVASEVTEVKGWHFQKGKIEELPRPTASWLSKRSGLSKGQISQLLYSQNEDGTFGGKPFKVNELIVLANTLNTTIQFLLTPRLTSILSDLPVSYYKGSRKRAIKTPISQWHLWLHSLAPLPEQNFYLFEKHASHFAGYSEEKKSRNAKPGIHPTAMSAADIEIGPLSAHKRINNYLPPGKKDMIEPTSPIPSGTTHKQAELEILKANLGLFVEIRKLLRSTNLERPKNELGKIFDSGSSKVKAQIGQIMRLLKFTQID